MVKTLFLVNPHASRVRQTWRMLENKVGEWCSDYRVVMTQFAADVPDHLNQSIQDGVERIISIGGDGTNQHMINAVMGHRQKYPDLNLVFGTVPAGTGRDFARGIGLPLDSYEAAKYLLTEATPKKIDIGLARFADKTQYFLNMANAGIANDVVQRVERSSKRPWNFPLSVIGALLGYEPQAVKIVLDGDDWFEGYIYVTGVGNGRSTGQGIYLTPDAVVDDGYLDVVVGEKMPFLELAQVFPKIYSGTHIGHPRVHYKRATHVRIISQETRPISVDLDGEPYEGAPEMICEIVPQAINLLL